MKASDLIRQTFAPVTVWVERDGKTTVGKRPEWLDWPSHTAEEMGAKWEAPKVKRGKQG